MPTKPIASPATTGPDQARLLPRHRERPLRIRLQACLDCGRATTGRRCPEHAADHAARARLTTSERGYGAQHQQTRAALLPHAIGHTCRLCGEPMRHGQALDLDHTQPLALDPSSLGDQIVHASCNRRAGATIRRPHPEKQAA